MSKNTPRKEEQRINVGGAVFEELFFKFIESKYAISKDELTQILKEKTDSKKGFPIKILRNEKLSSLEAIVKFLRENRKLSYVDIGKLLDRNPKTLAVTYSVACKKMTEKFSEGKDSENIPFSVFTKKLSILEGICTYLYSQNHSYADISRLLVKDQRTIWTVCNRARKKLEKK